MNVISIVWFSGKMYYIDAMDKELFHSLSVIKQVFKRFYPNTSWEGELVPRRLVKNKPVAELIPEAAERHALMFSNGLDSTCAAFLHEEKSLLLII